MSKRIVLPTLVSLLFTLAAWLPASASAYSGPAGCPSWIAPYTNVRCTYHTNIHSFSVYASQSHWGAIWYAVGSCGGACTSTATLPGRWSGRPVVSNFTSRWMYIWSGRDS